MFDRGTLLTSDRSRRKRPIFWKVNYYRHDPADISQIKDHFHRVGLRMRRHDPLSRESASLEATCHHRTWIHSGRLPKMASCQLRTKGRPALLDGRHRLSLCGARTARKNILIRDDKSGFCVHFRGFVKRHDLADRNLVDPDGQGTRRARACELRLLTNLLNDASRSRLRPGIAEPTERLRQGHSAARKPVPTQYAQATPRTLSNPHFLRGQLLRYGPHAGSNTASRLQS
jgi:hypothetical protein